MTSLPQLAPSRPSCASCRPTSFPHAYPAENEMAEKTSTTPADMNQVSMVGLTMTSSTGKAFVAMGFNFFACRSLLDSRDLLFDASLGDLGAAVCRSLALSSDSGTRRRAVGWLTCCVCGVGSRSFRTALAHERRVVRDARRAASWSGDMLDAERWWDGLCIVGTRFEGKR